MQDLTKRPPPTRCPTSGAPKYGIRRYGFHGASHRAASERVKAMLPKPGLRHISCHLGGSSSIAAFRDGVAIDTSFGTSPQSGLPQNNRVGDIDAFAVLYMMKKLGVGPDEMARILGTQSGLAGISGRSGDIRDLDEGCSGRRRRVRSWRSMFLSAPSATMLAPSCWSWAAWMSISFSGGIGENSADIRSAVCRDLAGFGIELDEAAERRRRARPATDFNRASPVKVLIVPADEESIVARETVGVVEQARSSAINLAR